MGRNPQVDAYIQQAAPFARPILEHLRTQVHAACPTVEETLKWGHPHFLHQGMMCSMAAFKAHCAFGFWKATLVFEGLRPLMAKDSMGHLGRLTALEDLPEVADLRALIARAAGLNEAAQAKPKKPRPAPRPALALPADLMEALGRNAAAQQVFDRFSPSHRRDYIEWLMEAKTEATRGRRLAQAIEWIAEGKPRYWKYQKRT